MNIQNKKSRYRSGFTIIELIVVIVVIGILAGISIVSYGAWRHSATSAKVKSDLNGVSAAMESARTFNNVYPSTVPSSIVASSGVTLSGGSTDGTTYCVEADSTEDPTITYYVASASISAGAQAGTCAGVTNIPLPSAPTGLAITFSTYNSLAASWTAVTGATGYTFQCATDAAFVNNVSQAQTSASSVTLSSLSQNTSYYCRVESTNTSGNSAWSSSIQANTQATIWNSLAYQNNWADYSTSYSSAAYTKTSAGVVVLKGMTRRTTGTYTRFETIGVLPVGYRPSSSIMFATSISPNITGRIDISSNGVISCNICAETWTSLDGIHFVPSDGTYSSTLISTFANGWTNFGSGYAPASYVVDSLGRVHTQGLVVPGTFTNGYQIFDMPISLLPSGYSHILNLSDGPSLNLLGIEYRTGTAPTGIVAKGLASTTGYYSLQSMYYPASLATQWTNLTLVNGWAWDGSIYSTPQYTKAADGIVSLKGLIVPGTAPPILIATLPPGYRPAKRLLLSTVGNNAYVRIDIDTYGGVWVMAGATGWTSLDGLSFMAEQ